MPSPWSRSGRSAQPAIQGVGENNHDWKVKLPLAKNRSQVPAGRERVVSQGGKRWWSTRQHGSDQATVLEPLPHGGIDPRFRQPAMSPIFVCPADNRNGAALWRLRVTLCGCLVMQSGSPCPPRCCRQRHSPPVSPANGAGRLSLGSPPSGALGPLWPPNSATGRSSLAMSHADRQLQMPGPRKAGRLGVGDSALAECGVLDVLQRIPLVAGADLDGLNGGAIGRETNQGLDP